MTRYFDKDFFKFFMGFLAIVSLSLLIIIATRQYVIAQEATANVVSFSTLVK